MSASSPLPHPPAARSRPSHRVRRLARTDGAAWLYLFKALLATFIALGVSMRLDLPAPKTAMTTVFIVMQPQSGAVLAKSFYRVAGTIFGLIATLTFVGCSRSSRSCSCWRSPSGSRCAPPAPRATATSAATASCSPAIRPR